MGKPQFHSNRRTFSANNVLNKLGASLGSIREDDGLTWDDVGRVLGKHRDRAAAYSAGCGDMGVVSFLLGCERWNGRFANDSLSMIGMKLVPLDGGQALGRDAATKLTTLLLEMSVALEDGLIDDTELVAMRGALDEAGRTIDAMRERLGPKANRA